MRSRKKKGKLDKKKEKEDGEDYHPYLFTREKTVSKKLGKVFHREICLPGLKAVSDSPGWKTRMQPGLGVF
jgi:hypothetical protein